MNLFYIIVGILIIFLILRFVAQMVFRVILLAIIIAVAVYAYKNLKGKLGLGAANDFILYELQHKYCDANTDKVKCDCIIEPLVKDVKANYSDEQIEEVKGEKIKSIEIILKSLKTQKRGIKECLRQHQQDSAWNQVLTELKEFDMSKPFKDSYQTVLK